VFNRLNSGLRIAAGPYTNEHGKKHQELIVALSLRPQRGNNSTAWWQKEVQGD
jgi:hypothetical protein